MKKLYVIICLLLSTLVLWSCDDLLDSPHDVRYDNLPSVTCNLKLRVGEMVVKNSLGTRTSEPSGIREALTDNEKKVHNVWVFQFAENGNKLLTAGYYIISDQAELSHLPVVLKALDTESTILIVTNTNDPNWMKGKTINTLDELKNLSLGEPRPVLSNDLKSDVFAIPMEGQLDAVNTSTATDITVPVEVMYAKLKIKVKIKKSIDASLHNINVMNIPWNSTVKTRSCGDGSRYEAEEQKPATYPDNTQWISRTFSSASTESADGAGSTSTEQYEEYGEYVIYVPENIQGESNNPSTSPLKKGDDAPQKALAISTTIKKNNSTDESQFTVYPGGNTYNNFNVKRNRVYRIEVTLKSFKETERQPSSNCFVVEPGNMLSFEPYYRIEKGGGYNFSSYLDTRDASKKIAKVSILWQTKDCIGDNSGGNLVYLGDEDNSGTIPSKQKIYVKTQKEGNALIAAYNSSDKIIWSWHIWVTQNDPGNIGNAVVYTTYDWNATGINSDNRVPRYAIMPCNLGALDIDFPATLPTATRCHGLLYQWGRKDPFPAIEKMDDHWGALVYDYTSDMIGKYYGNDNVTEVGMTAGDEGDKLFHSVAGATIRDTPAIFDDPMGFAVNHPTVFMCGTERCNPKDIYASKDADYVSHTGNYLWQGDWYPKHDDKLWGAEEPKADESMKHLQVAFARIWRTTNPNDGYEAFPLSIFDNYGPDKTIFDPCPAGWRVSSGDLWLGFTRTGNNPKLMDDVNYDETHSASWGMSMYMRAFRQGPTSYFPCQGLRFGDGTVGRANRCGNYHNATPDVDNHVNIVHIHNDIGFFHNLEYEYYQMFVKSSGCPVKCVRDRL